MAPSTRKPAPRKRNGLPKIDRLGGKIDPRSTPSVCIAQVEQPFHRDCDTPYLAAYDGLRLVGRIVETDEATIALDPEDIVVAVLAAGARLEAFRAVSEADRNREGGHC